MTASTVVTLGLSALRAAGAALNGRVRFPRHRIGDVLELPDGSTFVVYRETALRPVDDVAEGGVVLVFRASVADSTVANALREVLFDPVANVATPFFAGLPGFRRKVWLAGERRGEYLELYEWATRDDAARFVGVLRSLLAPVDFAGAASFEVVGADSVDAYVAARAIDWRDERERAVRVRRRSAVLTAAIPLGVAIAVAYRLRTAVSDADSPQASGGQS